MRLLGKMVDLAYALDMLDNDSVLENMLQGDVVLIETTADLLEKLTPALLDVLTKEKTAIVLLSNKGYFDILPSLKQRGIDTGKVFFVDCVSKSRNQKIPDTGHIVDLDSVSQLKTVFSSLLDKTDAFAGSSFLCIESLNKLIALNPASDFAKFLHVLLTKLRTKGVGCLLLSVQDEVVDDLRAEIVQLFDRVLHF